MSPTTITTPKRETRPLFVVNRTEADGPPRSPGLDISMPPLRSLSIRSIEDKLNPLNWKRKSSSGLRNEADSDSDSPNNKENRASTPELLPDDRQKLDGLLNYHLGELVRLKPIVVRLNEDINMHWYKARGTKSRREDVGMASSITTAGALVRDSLRIRNMYLRYVTFHRDEIERIGEKVVELKKQNGEKELVPPQVVTNMLGKWYEWDNLFSFTP